MVPQLTGFNPRTIHVRFLTSKGLISWNTKMTVLFVQLMKLLAKHIMNLTQKSVLRRKIIMLSFGGVELE